MKPIIISDVQCHDCGGTVTLFAVPDNVWRGIGLRSQWVCIGCVTKRINPKATVKDLAVELRKHRRRFNLKLRNKICGVPVVGFLLAIGDSKTTGVKAMTAKQVMGDYHKPVRFIRK